MRKNIDRIEFHTHIREWVRRDIKIIKLSNSKKMMKFRKSTGILLHILC